MIFSETDIRVRYADTDQMKFAYYGKFFEYFEQGRSDLLRAVGMPYPELEQMGYFLPVVEAHARYMKSARYDDLLIVKTMLRDLPQVRVRIEYEVRLHPSGDFLAEGYTVHSFVNGTTGKPTRAPEEFVRIVAEKMTKAIAVKK
jgi:acyl-CoA thioester hydrolase